MIDCLSGLWHHGVVGRDNDNRKVRQLGTAGTHGCEGLVARGVEEGDVTTVLKGDIVGTDVLGNASGLTRNHIGLADIVEKRGLTVVDMTHYRDDRRTGYEIFLAVCLLLKFLGNLSGDEFHLVAELLGNQHESLGIETLVDGHHETKTHTSSDDLDYRSVVHQGGKVVDRYELGHFEDLVLRSLLHHLVLGPECGSLSLLLAVLGSEVVLLVFIHLGIGLLDLLLDLLLHLLLLGLGQSRTESGIVFPSTVTAVLLSPALIVVVVLARGSGAVVGGVLAGLGKVYLLLADALVLLGRFAVKLAEVNLSYNLQR